MKLFPMLGLFIMDKRKLLAKITILLIITTGYTIYILNKYHFRDNLEISSSDINRLGISNFFPGDTSSILDLRVNDETGQYDQSIDCSEAFLNLDVYNQYIVVLFQYNCFQRLSIYDSSKESVKLSIIGNVQDFLITSDGMLILSTQTKSSFYIWEDLTITNSFYITSLDYFVEKHTMRYHAQTDSLFYLNSDNHALIQYKLDENESIEFGGIERSMHSYDIQQNSEIIAFRPSEWNNRDKVIITDLYFNWTWSIIPSSRINKLLWLPNSNKLLVSHTQKEEITLFDLMINNRTFKEIGRIKGEPKSPLGNIQQLFSIDPNANYIALSTSRSNVINNNGDTSYDLKLELIDINSVIIKEVLFNERKTNYVFINDLKWVDANELIMMKSDEIIRIMIN